MMIVNEKIKAYYVADDIDEVLNYIDNLEQENARLKEELKYTVPMVEHNKIVSEKLKENARLKGFIKDLKHIVACPVNIKELEAIKKQIEELEWNV